jgi:predicted phage terminase large subunit-like protein
MTIQPLLTDTKLLELDASGLPLAIVTPLVREHLDGCMRGHKSLAAAASRADRPQTTLAWGRRYLPKYFTKPASLMHEWLAAQLDACRAARGSKVNLVGPRGSAKSTIATLCYVLRMAVEGYEPYIWIVSDTAQQAKLHLENVKLQLTNNDLLAEDYAHAVGSGPRWRGTYIELPNRVVIESLGTGQRIRGRRFDYHRPSLIVCDDLQNDDHISSGLQRRVSREWFQGSLLKAGNPRTNFVNLATALHREALAVQLLTAPGWTSRRFSSIEEWPTNTALWDEWETLYCDARNCNAKHDARAFYEAHREEMDAGAVVLWPAEEDLYTLMQTRVEGGRTAFEREKQGSPIDPDVCEWPEIYFADHIWFDEWPSNLVIRAIALDPSKGRDAQHGDYSAYVLLGFDRDGTVYVEADLARRPTPQMVADGVALCRRFRPDGFGVEANQFQELLCYEFAREFKRQGMEYIVPAAIHNTVKKQVRIRRLGPYLSRRQMRFLSRSASTQLLVDQLRDFPAGAHDDGPDALEMALRLAEEVWHGRNSSDGLGNRLPVG